MCRNRIGLYVISYYYFKWQNSITRMSSLGQSLLGKYTICGINLVNEFAFCEAKFDLDFEVPNSF